jgi:hypothetical protein
LRKASLTAHTPTTRYPIFSLTLNNFFEASLKEVPASKDSEDADPDGRADNDQEPEDDYDI